MKPGMMHRSLNVSSTSWLCVSSQGRIVSSVPTSTMRPSRTATASATGRDGSMVRTVRAGNTVISAMYASMPAGSCHYSSRTVRESYFAGRVGPEVSCPSPAD